MSAIHDAIARIQTEIAAATLRSGRPVGAAELMIVSKTQPASIVAEAVSCPHLLFGENRVQELLEKAPTLPPTLRWHVIGTLQKNKIRKVLPHIEAIQSVDSLKLAQAIQRIAEEEDRTVEIYAQVNIAQDDAKHGFTAESVTHQWEALLSLSRLRLRGLMTVPAFNEDPEASRPHFAALRQLRDDLERRGGRADLALSMGMSGDFTIAIEEGATLVRVGSAIFGARS
jgi:PLP dependent protein